VWSDNVFQHAAHGQHAQLERLLSIPRLFIRKFPFKDPDITTMRRQAITNITVYNGIAVSGE